MKTTLIITLLMKDIDLSLWNSKITATMYSVSPKKNLKNSDKKLVFLEVLKSSK